MQVCFYLHLQKTMKRTYDLILKYSDPFYTIINDPFHTIITSAIKIDEILLLTSLKAR